MVGDFLDLPVLAGAWSRSPGRLLSRLDNRQPGPRCRHRVPESRPPSALMTGVSVHPGCRSGQGSRHQLIAAYDDAQGVTAAFNQEPAGARQSRTGRGLRLWTGSSIVALWNPGRSRGWRCICGLAVDQRRHASVIGRIAFHGRRDHPHRKLAQIHPRDLRPTRSGRGGRLDCSAVRDQRRSRPWRSFC